MFVIQNLKAITLVLFYNITLLRTYLLLIRKLRPVKTSIFKLFYFTIGVYNDKKDCPQIWRLKFDIIPD